MRYICRRSKDYYAEISALKHNVSGIKLVPNILDKLRSFSQLEMILEGSFCYTGLKEISLSAVLTKFGMCFMFEFDLDVLNRDR